MPTPPQDPEDGNRSLSAYAGRWIARLWGRVVGQGGTPEQAKKAAQSSRHKETPQVNYVPTTSPLTFPPILDEVRKALPPKKRVYLVGGAVRDAVLKKESHDLDFIVSTEANKTARKVANALKGAYYNMDEEHDIGRVVLVGEGGERMIMDFAAMQGKDLEEDLRQRDFTINAMAVDMENPQELLDPLGGLSDLWNNQLRMCSPTTYTDDPVRIMRAVRMAAQFKLSMLPETKAGIKPVVERLPEISPERIRDELFKILDSRNPAASIRALDMLGILDIILSEMAAMKGVTQSSPHIYDVWEHTLHTVQRMEYLIALLDTGYVYDEDEGGDIYSGLVSLKLGRYREQITSHIHTDLVLDRSARPLLYLGALYHDITKPEHRTEEEGGRIRFIGHEESGAKAISRRGDKMHLSNSEIMRLKTVVQNHMRPWQLAKDDKLPSRRAIYRFWRATEEAGIDICLLSVADLLAIYGHTLPQEMLEHHLDVVRALLEAYWEMREKVVHPLAVVDGKELIKALKLKPGPMVGEILEAIREAQAVGEIETKGDALEFAERWVRERK